jgi:hypothetical protein
LPHLCGVIGTLLLSYSPLFGGGVFFVGGLFQRFAKRVQCRIA